MADNRRYFVICEDNCKFESMTKEQILAAITQAVVEGEIHDVDTGFVTKLKEQNAGKELKVWVGSQAQYNALIPDEDTLYFITDPSMEAELQTKIDALEAELQAQGTPMRMFKYKSEIDISKTYVFFFEQGMTFEEWVNSDYNYAQDNNCGQFFKSGNIIIESNVTSTDMYTNEEIQTGHLYNGVI